jgi:hypothetical protein
MELTAADEPIIAHSVPSQPLWCSSKSADVWKTDLIDAEGKYPDLRMGADGFPRVAYLRGRNLYFAKGQADEPPLYMAALGSGTKCYFFSGAEYIRVTRGGSCPGVVDRGYPKPIQGVWGWGAFGQAGIDAALRAVSKCYFFSGDQYIRVTRGDAGPGTVDSGYPKNIDQWGWGLFGQEGIDAALESGAKSFFFSGTQYIRVTRGNEEPWTIDHGYPKDISRLNWGTFGQDGIDAAMSAGTKAYFFSGNQYIRVNRTDTEPWTIEPGYPKTWGWPATFQEAW